MTAALDPVALGLWRGLRVQGRVVLSGGALTQPLPQPCALGRGAVGWRSSAGGIAAEPGGGSAILAPATGVAMPSTPSPELDFSRLRLGELAQLRNVAAQRQDDRLLALVEAEWKRRERSWKAVEAERPSPAAGTALSEEPAAAADPDADPIVPESPDLSWRVATDGRTLSYCHVRPAEPPAAFSTYRLARPHLLRP